MTLRRQRPRRSVAAVARTYVTGRGVETRYVPVPDGRHATHVVTASGEAIDVTSGAAAGRRMASRMAAPAVLAATTRARVAALTARVDAAMAAAAVPRERAESAERMRARLLVSRLLTERASRQRDPAPPTRDPGNRPGIVWRAVDDDPPNHVTAWDRPGHD